MKNYRLLGGVVAAGFVVASTAFAQVVHVPLYLFGGSTPSGQFGFSVSGAGDVNNDGFDDVIVGERLDDSNGTDSGSALVFSGATGGVLYTFNGSSAGGEFGISVSGAGDVNNDGFADLIVGAHLESNSGPLTGTAYIFSGATGAVLYTFEGGPNAFLFGGSVSGAGDVNNDGFDDVIIGARFDNSGGVDSGSAKVFSGATGAVLYAINGEVRSDQFGGSVSGAGDVNNDGFADFIVGAIGNDNDNTVSGAGAALVFSGATGEILHRFIGESINEFLGICVSGAGDVDNDGFDDLVVGAISTPNSGSGSGSVRVFSGATGALLHIFRGQSGSDSVGRSVSGAGDVNHDGFDDIIVGSSLGDDGAFTGGVRVFSGATGEVLSTINGEAELDFFGASVSSAGDVNNDGLADIIIGADGGDLAAAARGGDPDPSTGTAYVFISTLGTSEPCLGDANGDGTVSFADISSVLGNFGNQTTPFGTGDADGNGIVEFADIGRVLVNFGVACS